MATAAELSILITAQDKTHSALTGLRADLAAVDKAAHSFGASMQRIGERAAGFIVANVAQRGFGALVDGITSSISAASNLEESLNKARVVFGQASADVESFAAKSAQSLGISKRAALETAASFGNIFNTIGLTRSASAEMSVTLVKLASDMASFNNQDPSEMLLKLRAGLAGEAEPLRQFGVLLNESAVAAEAVRLGLASSTAAVSDSAKVQARYSLILQQSKIQQNDFANTSDNLANGQRKARATVEDLSASLGKSLIPAANVAVQALAGLGDDIDTTGIERAMLRIQLSIVGVLEKLETASIKLANFGKGAGNVLNDINAQVENAARFVNKNLNRFTGGLIPIAPTESGGGAGAGNPDSVFAGLRKALEDALANVGKDTEAKLTGLGDDALGAGNALATLKEKTLSIGDAFNAAADKFTSAAQNLFAKPTREEAGLNLQQSQFALDRLPQDARIRDQLERLQRQREAIEQSLANQPTQGGRVRESEREASERNNVTTSTNPQIAAIDRQIEALKKQSDALDKQGTKIDEQISLYEAQNKVQKDWLVLADRRLITEGEQNAKSQELFANTSAFTGFIKDAADKLGISLIPGFNETVTAAASLAKVMNEDVTTAYTTNAGMVRNVTDALGGFMDKLASFTLPAAPTPGWADASHQSIR